MMAWRTNIGTLPRCFQHPCRYGACGYLPGRGPVVTSPVGGQPLAPQAGLTATIGLGVPTPVGSTSCSVPFCHWNTNGVAAPFSPSAWNLTGPCTLEKVAPECKYDSSAELLVLLMWSIAWVSTWPEEKASATSALML